MYGYIYKTTNKLNGKFYIGKHKSSYFDPRYLGSGNYITAAIKKYGSECFTNEMIDTADNLAELNDKEKYWIAELNARELGYNIAPGGDGGEVWGDPSNHPSLGKPGLKGDDNPMRKMMKADPSFIERWKAKIKASKAKSKAKSKVSLAGRVCIVNSQNERKLVPPDRLEVYLDDGWIPLKLRTKQQKEQANQIRSLAPKKKRVRRKGLYHQSEEARRKIREAVRKTTSSPVYKLKHSAQIKEALANRSDEQKQAFSEMRCRIQTGKHPSDEARKKCSETMKNLYKNGYVSPQKGKPSWNKGMKLSKEQCDKLSTIAKGRIHITDGTTNKMIHPEEFDHWAELGFYKGRTLHNKSTVD